MVYNNPVCFVDIYGMVWSWGMGAIGATAGAVGGFSGSLLYESLSALRGSCFSWNDIIVTTTIAATAGFLGGAAFGAATGDPTALIGGAAITGLVGGAVGAAVNDALGGNPGCNGDNSTNDDYQEANPNAFGVL